MQVAVKADSPELQYLVRISISLVRSRPRKVTSPQVQLVATGEMSIICGCSGVAVLTSAGTSLSSHPNSPSLFQGEVLDQESFDLTPAVAVRGCCSAPGFIATPFNTFCTFHLFGQVTVCITRPLAKQKCLR